MTIGFTGTRRGLTPRQRVAVAALINELRPTRFHHGACVGADEEVTAAIGIVAWPCEIRAHPGKSVMGGPNELLSQSALQLSGIVLPEKTHFARNRDIVHACDVLVATPWQTARPAKGTGGGTWYTVEYAEKCGKPVAIIWPDGKVDR